MTQLSSVVIDRSTLTPGNETIGTDEQSTIRVNLVSFTPVVINVPKLAFRPDAVNRQRNTMCRDDRVGCLTPCSSRAACQQCQRPVVQV